MQKKAPPLIELKDIVKKYPLESGEYYQALNEISLTVNEGDFIAIMGPSGSGKSTLMHIIGALDTLSGGKFLLKGKDITSYTSDQLAEIRNQEIGFIFQAFNLLPRTTVYKNVERPMLYAKVSETERKKRVMAALEKVGIADKVNNLANHISGGQIQRVAIARALIMNPSIILADEPTGNLDSARSYEIMEILNDLNKMGKTIVLITHEDEIAEHAKRKIKLIDGKIVSDVTFKNKR